MERQVFKIYNGDTTISYQTSAEINQQVVDKIIAWCKKYNQGCGESLHQSDDGNIYAPDLVSDIIDNVLKFDYED